MSNQVHEAIRHHTAQKRIGQQLTESLLQILSHLLLEILNKVREKEFYFQEVPRTTENHSILPRGLTYQIPSEVLRISLFHSKYAGHGLYVIQTTLFPGENRMSIK